MSDILTRLSLKGALYFRTAFTPPWGVAVPSFENVARFHLAHRGACSVRIDQTGETASLEQGDLVIIPHGAAHSLISDQAAATRILPLDEVIEASGYKGEGVLVYDGGASSSETQLICGHFSFDRAARHPIFERLPSHIVVRNYGDAAAAWIEATLRVIDEGGVSRGAGGDLVALKMSEAIFAQALRSYVDHAGPEIEGVAGFADPFLSRALDAFHKAPECAWRVESLAREAGLSRTAFATRFVDMMRVTPMQYVTDWRMRLAREGLAGRGLSVSEAAALAGYASEASFSRAFKKEVGLSPAAYRAQAERAAPLAI